MFKLLTKIIVFFLPIGLLFVFPIFVYIKGGEFTSIERVIQAQKKDRSIIFGQAYSYGDATYKISLISKTKPKIIILGTSRVLQFRNIFFNEPDSFKNAGRFVENVNDYATFIQELPESYSPEVILVGLDPWLFVTDQNQKARPEQETIALKIKNFISYGWRDTYKDYFSKKFTLVSLIEKSKNSNNMGLNAIINQNGFLYDGSLFNGKEINDRNRLANLTKDINYYKSNFIKKRANIEYTPIVPKSTIDSIDNFLELCKKKNIEVVGFVIPFPHAIFEAFTNQDDIYSRAVYNFPNILKKEFNNYGFTIFDYSDSGNKLISDTEFVDAVHPTDKGVLKLLIDMAENNTTLSKYVDINKLNKLLVDSSEDFIMTQLPHNP